MAARTKTSTSAKANDKADGNAKAVTCLTPKCTRPARTRGLCEGCYQMACRLIRYDGTSWAELERFGLAAPAERRRQQPMLVAFHEMKAKRSAKK